MKGTDGPEPRAGTKQAEGHSGMNRLPKILVLTLLLCMPPAFAGAFPLACTQVAAFDTPPGEQDLLPLFRQQGFRPLAVFNDRVFACECLPAPRLGAQIDQPALGGASDTARLGHGDDQARLGGADDLARLQGADSDARLGGASSDARLDGSSDAARLAGEGGGARSGQGADAPRLGGATDQAALAGGAGQSRLAGDQDSARIGGGEVSARIEGAADPLTCRITQATPGYEFPAPFADNIRIYDGT